MRALVVDDEAPARGKLRRWLSEQPGIEVTEAADGLSAARSIAKWAPQVVFLDIQMPGLSGLEVAAQLQSDTAPLIVFVTAHSDHALRAFDLNAVDYLLKPYDKERLLITLSRVRTRALDRQSRSKTVDVARAQTGASERLLVPYGEQLRLIDTASILWIEANDNYLCIRTAAGDYHLRRTLQDLLVQLGEARFARIHKSTAVNLAEIAALHPLFKGDYEIELHNGQRVRLSRRYKDALFSRMVS